MPPRTCILVASALVRSLQRVDASPRDRTSICVCVCGLVGWWVRVCVSRKEKEGKKDREKDTHTRPRVRALREKKKLGFENCVLQNLENRWWGWRRS